jgi:dGTPase
MKSFSFKHLYRHPQVMEMTNNAQTVVRGIVRCLSESARNVPDSQREETPRAVADYIAGMTDRYAAREHER